jgi:hypothetical protein
MTEETTTATNEGTEGTGSAPDTNAATPDGDTTEKNAEAGLKAALAAERKKRQEAEKAAQEFEEFKRKQADEAAQKANDVEKFKTERDQYEGEAKQWREYATKKLEAIGESLDEVGQGVLDALGDDVSLAKRLAIAEQLSSQKKAEPGFGTKGGKSSDESHGLIPSEARTSRAAYDQWLAGITASGDPAQMSVLLDSKKRQQLEREARELFG